jgi:hypothetical protein
MVQGAQNNRLIVAGKVLENLSLGFPNLKREDHEFCISNLYHTFESKDNFNTAIGDYLVMLDIHTNQDLV